ncbi:hypothetical protein KCV03_g109, partial [Aureobasidium melanogenum]
MGKPPSSDPSIKVTRCTITIGAWYRRKTGKCLMFGLWLHCRSALACQHRVSLVSKSTHLLKHSINTLLQRHRRSFHTNNLSTMITHLCASTLLCLPLRAEGLEGSLNSYAVAVADAAVRYHHIHMIIAMWRDVNVSVVSGVKLRTHAKTTVLGRRARVVVRARPSPRTDIGCRRSRIRCGCHFDSESDGGKMRCLDADFAPSTYWLYVYVNNAGIENVLHDEHPCYVSTESTLRYIQLSFPVSLIRVLTSTNTGLRILDTSSTFTTALAIVVPEESPVVRVRAQLTIGRCGASVSLTSAVRGTMVGVVLVVDLEDGKRLSLRGSRIVAALGGLNGLAGLCGAAGRRFGCDGMRLAPGDLYIDFTYKEAATLDMHEPHHISIQHDVEEAALSRCECYPSRMINLGRQRSRESLLVYAAADFYRNNINHFLCFHMLPMMAATQLHARFDRTYISTLSGYSSTTMLVPLLASRPINPPGIVLLVIVQYSALQELTSTSQRLSKREVNFRRLSGGNTQARLICKTPVDARSSVTWLQSQMHLLTACQLEYGSNILYAVVDISCNVSLVSGRTNLDATFWTQDDTSKILPKWSRIATFKPAEVLHETHAWTEIIPSLWSERFGVLPVYILTTVCRMDVDNQCRAFWHKQG